MFVGSRLLDKVYAIVADLRRVARRRLPHGVFDYIDGGAEDERSLARNSAAFADYEFQPRVLRDVSNLDTSTTLFGRSMSMPVILAPTGYSRIADSQGELAVARAAARRTRLCRWPAGPHLPDPAGLHPAPHSTTSRCSRAVGMMP